MVVNHTQGRWAKARDLSGSTDVSYPFEPLATKAVVGYRTMVEKDETPGEA